MSWIDDARLKIAKREAEKATREKVEIAKFAKATTERAARGAKLKERLPPRIKRLLPQGVELIGIISASPDSPSDWTARVHVGNGVQFDLVRGARFSRNGRAQGSYNIIEVYAVGADSNTEQVLSSLMVPSWSFRPDINGMLIRALERYDVKQQTG